MKARLRLRSLSLLTSQSIAGRLALWFTVISIVLLLAKSLLSYWIIAPRITAQEEEFVRAKLALAVLRLEEGVQAGTLATVMSEEIRSVAGGAYLRLMDEGGHVLRESPGMDQELAYGIAAGETPTLSRGQSGREYWVAGRPLTRHRVEIAVEANEFRLFAPSGGRLWLALVVALLLSGLAGHRIATHGIRPLERFAHSIREIEEASLGNRINVRQLPVELRPLGKTFNDMLERLGHSFSRLSQFSDDIAHELRTPLAIMRGQIDVALSEARSEGEYREVLESCREEIGALSELVQRLLFLSRVENHTVPLSFADFDLKEEMLALQEFYEPLATEANIALAVEGSAIYVHADRLLLRRAVGNLVSNAIRHTPANGRVTLSVAADHGGVHIGVQDTGCGIAAEHLPHLFDRFFRADPARETGGGHIGLGMAIAKAIVALHGGTIEVASTPGQGTSLAITLPAG